MDATGACPTTPQPSKPPSTQQAKPIAWGAPARRPAPLAPTTVAPAALTAPAAATQATSADAPALTRPHTASSAPVSDAPHCKNRHIGSWQEKDPAAAAGQGLQTPGTTAAAA
jgi:hypothetical protein